MGTSDFFKKLAAWIGKVWTGIGLLIVFYVLLNAATGMIVLGAAYLRKPLHPVPGNAHDHPAWEATYLKSLQTVRARWWPYVYWKMAPTRSPYLNVDDQGNRVTWNNPSGKGQNDARPLRVFMFGGSTMWGHGVRDDYTIPSLLAKRLARNGDYNVAVVNQGQIGYVSTQELLVLYELLRDGERPKVVVFYDGINDCLAAYQGGIAGLTVDEFDRVFEFNLLNRSFRKNLYLSAAASLLIDRNVVQLANLFDGRNNEQQSTDNSVARSTLGYLQTHREPDAKLERNVVDVYLFNKAIVEMLGKQFGFRSLFYWQPVIYTKNKLTPQEATYSGAPSLKQFILPAYARLAAVAPANGIKDLSTIFKDDSRTYFRDMAHLNEGGDQIIADMMARDITQVLASIRQSSSDPMPSDHLSR